MNLGMSRILMKNIITCVLSLMMVLGTVLSGCVTDKPSRLLLSQEVVEPAGASKLIIVTIPVGPSTGDVDVKLTYSADVKSGISGELTYGFDWGDGSYTWAVSAIASHSWPSSGIYVIRAQARCNDVVSDWSLGKAVVIGIALSRSPLSRPEQAMCYVTTNAEEIRTAVKIILSTESGKPYNEFNALRDWVATRIFYKSDQDNFGVSDYWQFPLETLERGTGDCEDIAILLCSLLRASGVPADQVYVAIGTPKGTEGYHAYLLERYSKGVWSMIEPQLDPVTSAFSFTFLDWALTYDFSSDLFCFNDQYVFNGAPVLASGAYEFNLWHSLWPFLPCASVNLERQLRIDDRVEGVIEWLGTDKIIVDWAVNIYSPSSEVVLKWSGNDLKHDFALRAAVTGVYRLEIIKRDYTPRNVRIILSPPGWKKPSK
jgi:predicted transglutaminase-like cysteine proteinase